MKRETRLAKGMAVDFATKSPLILFALREKVAVDVGRSYEGDEEFEFLSRIR